MMKKIVVSAVLMLMVVLGANAEEQQKFSPEKFQADLEQFITNEAGLTTEEAAKFFPLYREMQQKQRVVYNKMRELFKIPSDEAASKRAIQRRDQYELELKQIAQTYHNKFLRVVSATKVYKTIIAEDQFHRRAFRNFGAGGHRGGHRK
jgi:hypothetical protein